MSQCIYHIKAGPETSMSATAGFLYQNKIHTRCQQAVDLGVLGHLDCSQVQQSLSQTCQTDHDPSQLWFVLCYHQLTKSPRI